MAASLESSEADEVFSMQGGFKEETSTIDFHLNNILQRMGGALVRNKSHVFYVGRSGFYLTINTVTSGASMSLIFCDGKVPDSVACKMKITGIETEYSIPFSDVNLWAKPQIVKGKRYKCVGKITVQQVSQLPNNILQLHCSVTTLTKTKDGLETKILR